MQIIEPKRLAAFHRVGSFSAQNHLKLQKLFPGLARPVAIRFKPGLDSPTLSPKALCKSHIQGIYELIRLIGRRKKASIIAALFFLNVGEMLIRLKGSRCTGRSSSSRTLSKMKPGFDGFAVAALE